MNELNEGEYTLRIICSNKNENHSFPFRKKIRILNPAKENNH